MSINNINNILVSLLNLRLSDVDSIDISDNTINITLSRSTMICPHCGCPHLKSKGFYSRKVTVSSDIFKNYTINLKVRRYYCEQCTHSFSDTKNLAPANRKITYDTIFKTMELLKNSRVTFKDVADELGISPSTVVRIFDMYCHIPRRQLPEAICIDEVYTKNSNFDSKYSCIIYDFLEHKIIDVTPSRRMDYLGSYFYSIDIKERNMVKYVCMDMYRPYKILIQRYFKKAIICVDSFHVIKTLNDSLENIRIRVMKKYDTNSIEYYLLKNFNYLLKVRNINLDNKARLNNKLGYYINLRGIFNMMISIDNNLKTAYYLKETYIVFNSTSNIETARERYDYIYNKFVEANIPELQPFVTILKNWKDEIIHSFIIYKGRRINNGVAESINSKVSLLIYNSKGIYNNKRRRKRIMYAVNKDGFILK